jgi:peptide/nickel transport system substrate-binding protein
MKKLLILCLSLFATLAFGQGGTLTVALPPATRITYLFPITPANDQSNYNFQVQYLLYKPLLWVGKKITVNYARSIASSVTTTNGRRYVVTLNPKWHWSDGTPVTSADVLFFWDMVRTITANNAAAYYGWGIGGVPQEITSVWAEGPYRLVFTLDRAVNPLWFELNGLAQFIPLPEHAWNKYPGNPAKTLAYLQAQGSNVAFFRNSPVDGPFMVDHFVQDQEYVLRANPHYSGHHPNYTYLVERYFTTSDAEFNALRGGEIDVGYLPIHLFNQAHLPGYRFASLPQWGFFYIYVNFANPAAPALKDLTVRQALQMAINGPGMLKTILHNQGIAEYGPVPYDPPTYLSAYLKTHVPYPFNPAKGKALLEAHGWKLVNGIMTKGGERLEFTLRYASGNQAFQQEAELFAEDAAQEGIRINLKPEPFDTIIGSLGDPKGWSLDYWGGWTYQPDFFPSGDGIFNTGGGSNESGYSDPLMDRLIQATTDYLPKEAVLNAMYNYQNYFAQQLPVLFVPIENQLFEVKSTVRGVIQSFNPTVTNWTPQDWTLH